jgi:hypothetical protein
VLCAAGEARLSDTGRQVEEQKTICTIKSKLQISEVCESVDVAEKDIRTCNDK